PGRVRRRPAVWGYQAVLTAMATHGVEEVWGHRRGGSITLTATRGRCKRLPNAIQKERGATVAGDRVRPGRRRRRGYPAPSAAGPGSRPVHTCAAASNRACVI